MALVSPPTEPHDHQPATVLATQARMVFRGNAPSVDVRIQKPVGKGMEPWAMMRSTTF